MACLALGYLIHPWNPIIKRICTSSFTIFSTGWVLLMLLAFYWVVEVKGYTKWTFPFVVIGANSIFIYSVEQVLRSWLNRAVGVFTFRFTFLGDFAPVAQACAVLLVMCSCAIGFTAERSSSSYRQTYPMKRAIPKAGLLLSVSSMLFTPLWAAPAVISIESKNIRVEFDSLLHSRIVAIFDGKATPLGDFGPSEFVTAADLADAGLHAQRAQAGERARRTRPRAPPFDYGHCRRSAEDRRGYGLRRDPADGLLPGALHEPIGRRAARVAGWTNNPLFRDGGRRGRAGLLVVPERLVPESSRLGDAAEGRISSRRTFSG